LGSGRFQTISVLSLSKCNEFPFWASANKGLRCWSSTGRRDANIAMNKNSTAPHTVDTIHTYSMASTIVRPLLSDVPPTNCSSPLLASPSYSNFTVSILLLLGILVSYLPQHHRIINRRTSEGISPLFLRLGVTSGTCALANIWMLGWGVVECCGSDLGPFQCFAGMLGILQVTTQWACFMVM
jgi:hypothetical protein